jgi:hypothetical protein
LENIDLYPAIFKRKSVRRYDPTPLDEAILAKITRFTATLKPLYDDIKTEMKIVSGDTVRGLFGVKAPHFLVFSSEKKTGYLTNAGFLLQQVDLSLSTNEIGSCWQGVAKPFKGFTVSSGLEIVITLAFGRPAEPSHRKMVEEFRRVSMDKISEVKGMDDLLEAARLAPSANNSQMWFFTGGDGRINVYMAKSLFLGRVASIDAGIAICHIWVATIHQGKHFMFVQDLEAEKNAPSGKFYVATLRVS